jgi:hypothetical protein
MSDCKHMNFAAHVGVARLEGTAGRPMSFMAEITVKCTECGTPFEFLGLEPGIDTQGAKVSMDGQEARIAIVPKGTRPNPLHRLGFGVRSFQS